MKITCVPISLAKTSHVGLQTIRRMINAGDQIEHLVSITATNNSFLVFYSSILSFDNRKNYWSGYMNSNRNLSEILFSCMLI